MATVESQLTNTFKTSKRALEAESLQKRNASESPVEIPYRRTCSGQRLVDSA